MSNKWLFFPSPAASGILQVITWNMTSASAATTSSTGQDIIFANKTSSLQYGGPLMRLWNGVEAQNSGANTSNHFATAADCRAWWLNYSVSATLNGGSSISLNSTTTDGSGANENIIGAVRGEGNAKYLNLLIAVKASDLVSGDVVVFTVTAFP